MDANQHLNKEINFQKQKRKVLRIVLIIVYLLIIPTMFFLIFDSSSTISDKPIIYIYPQEETEVSVKVGYPENLTCTYPKYDENEGWNVIAKPNGDLQDLKTGKNLYALHWEGIGTKVYDYTNLE